MDQNIFHLLLSLVLSSTASPVDPSVQWLLSLRRFRTKAFMAVRATHRYGRLVTSRPCRRGGDSRRSHQCWLYVLVSAL